MIYEAPESTGKFKTQAECAAQLSRSAVAFAEHFGQKPTFAAVAPGRVNVIGEHVDYNGGCVLPAAINRFLSLVVRVREDGEVRLVAKDFPGEVWFDLSDLPTTPIEGWGRYAQGVLVGLQAAGCALVGFEAYLESEIPIGGGLSSSAALEAAVGLAALEVSGIPFDRLALAKLCQMAEHRYAGVPCGLMDQAAVLLSQPDALLLLDCETEVARAVPYDSSDWQLMVINTGVAHELADGEYGRRRTACHQAAEVLGVEHLSKLDPEGLSQVLAHPDLDAAMRRAVRHVVTENARTAAFIQALGEKRFREAGKLLGESHASLRDDYQVSCPELDFIVEVATPLAPVAGCRMTGGGFGGSCIALVEIAGVEAVTAALTKAYTERFGRAPGIFVTPPEAGAQTIAL